jgi:hypothetical protein
MILVVAWYFLGSSKATAMPINAPANMHFITKLLRFASITKELDNKKFGWSGTAGESKIGSVVPNFGFLCRSAPNKVSLSGNIESKVG